MATVTLSQIRDRSKEKADMANSSFIADAKWNDFINEGAAQLYDLQVGAYGEDYFVADPVTFNTVPNQDAYDFASDIGITDFYKLSGVDFIIGTNDIKPLRRFAFRDRTRGQQPFAWSAYTYKGIRYRLRGNKLWLKPTPIGVHQIQVYYTPTFTKMSDDADTFEAQNNWETYIVNYAAIQALGKEESDVRHLIREIERIEKMATEMAATRDIGEEEPPTDVNSMYDDSYEFMDNY